MTTALAIAFRNELGGFERAILFAFPVFGAFFTYVSWLHWRRYRSVRTEMVNGAVVYIWIELNGSETRSAKDPRPEWDAADGDSDGDSSGD